MAEKQAYRISELALAFGIGRSKIYSEISKGRLKTFKIGKATLISKSEVDKWAKMYQRGSGSK